MEGPLPARQAQDAGALLRGKGRVVVHEQTFALAECASRLRAPPRDTVQTTRGHSLSVGLQGLLPLGTSPCRQVQLRMLSRAELGGRRFSPDQRGPTGDLQGSHPRNASNATWIEAHGATLTHGLWLFWDFRVGELCLYGFFRLFFFLFLSKQVHILTLV